MNRWDIINAFIEKHNYKSYLEIGYYKGWSFDQVKCDLKVAVDPNPSKEEWMIKDNWGSFSDIEDGQRIQINKEASDRFFERLPENKRVDIIFIDGLHEAEQVSRDIENALKFLSPKGTIILHDCNPPKYEHTTTGIDGCWTGDAYRAVIDAYINKEIDLYTIDTDWGCGVIIPNPNPKLDGRTAAAIQAWQHNPSWEIFDMYRKELLNLISVEDFKTKLNERA